MRLTSALILASAIVPQVAAAEDVQNAVETGIPGYFDRATGTFEPLGADASKAATPIQGKIHVDIFIGFGSGNIPFDATVSCELSAYFSDSDGQFTEGPLQLTQDLDELDDERDESYLEQPFKYIPQIGNPQVKLYLKCSVRDNNGNVHSISYNNIPVQPVSTAVNASVSVDM